MALVDDALKVREIVGRGFRAVRARRAVRAELAGRPPVPDGTVEVAVYFTDGPENLYQLDQWYEPLRRLHERILAADPALDVAPPETRGPEVQLTARSAAPAQLPADVRAFTGRTAELATLALRRQRREDTEHAALNIDQRPAVMCACRADCEHLVPAAHQQHLVVAAMTDEFAAIGEIEKRDAFNEIRPVLAFGHWSFSP